MIGYSFFVFRNLVWRDNQGGVFLLSPPFKAADFSQEEAVKLLGESMRLFLRWESDFDSSCSEVWWHVIKDKQETLDMLSKNTQYEIRKAIKQYDVRPVSRDEIICHGYYVYRKAYARYKTHEPMFNKDVFVAAVLNLPAETEFWAAYGKDDCEMVAFSENYVSDDACFYLSIWFDPAAMKNSVGYLLIHEMNRYYLSERGVRYVSDGARSLSHNTNIHEFLQSKFGFRRAYARLNVVYVPWLAVMVRLAFPFRALIKRIPLELFKKTSILLTQEAIRRECQQGN